MKLFLMIFLVLSFSIFSTQALAQDFQAALQGIQARQKVIDHQMAQWGFSNHLTAAPQKNNSQAAEENSALFRIHGRMNATQIPAGKLLFGKTYLRLIVGSESTPAIVILDDGQGVFSGLKILGNARGSSTEGRLLIDFDRLLLRTGKGVPLHANALDPLGAYGLEAQVWSHKAWASIGAIASGFVSGVAASQQTTSTNAFGFSQSQPTGKNAILQGLAQSAADQSKKLMEDTTREKPVLVIEADTPVSVLVQDEVDL